MLTYKWLDESTVLVTTHSPWDWDAYVEASEALYAEIRGMNHPLHVIADVSGPDALPSDLIAQLPRLLTAGWPSRDVDLIVAVSTSHMVKIAADIFTRVYRPVVLVNTMEEALQLVENHVSSRS